MTLKMIKTDWIAIKSHHWRLVIMAAVVAVFGAVGLSMVIIPMAAYMAMAFSMNTFAVEEKGKLDSLYLTLPLSRKDIVRGRYVFMGATLLIWLLVSGAAVGIITPNMQFGELYMGVAPRTIAIMCSLGFAFGSFINLCMYPAMFRFGYEKGKIWGFYIPLVAIASIFGAVSALSTMESVLPTVLRWMAYWGENAVFVCAIMLAIGAALMYISYRLSLLLFAKRDI
jgi:ABC-type transport system involved in multi-copper enzyme maturation permease subunit